MSTTDTQNTGSGPTAQGALTVRWTAIVQHEERVTQDLTGQVVTYLSDYAKGVLAIVRSGDRLHSVPIDSLRITSETVVS